MIFFIHIIFSLLFFFITNIGVLAEEYYYFSINPIWCTVLTFLLRKKSKYPTYVIYLLSLISVLVPFFSIVIITLILLMFKILNFSLGDERDLEDIDELDIIQGQVEASRQETLSKLKDNAQINKDLEVWSSLEIEPYVDILRVGSKKLKLDVINKLSDIHSKESIDLLKMGLKDDEYEVKYFSNVALEKIENSEMVKIQDLSENIKTNPSDYNLYNERSFHYNNLVYLGIADKSNRKFFLEKALYDLLVSMQIKATQEGIYHKIALIYIRIEDYQNALDICKMALKLSISRDDMEKILFYMAEAAFKLQSQDDLENALVELRGIDKKGYTLIDEVLTFWGQGVSSE